MVVSPAPRQDGGARFGRLVASVTRAVTAIGVVTQSALLAVEVFWAVRDHTSVGEVIGRQGGLFAVTMVLAALGFWVTTQMRPADPLPRLRHSEALRLAAIRPHHSAPTRPLGRCAQQGRPAA